MNEQTSVLIVSHDVVGSRMAGPGIRYWELARVLSRHFQVTLAVPGEAHLPVTDVRLWPYDPGRWDSLAPAVKRADAVLLCGDVLAWFPMVQQAGVPLVVDGYDPHTLETLELLAGTPEQEHRHREQERVLQMQCRAGDFFICASERQRDWWLGLLEATGRINVHTYGEDPSLRRLIDVVPFGLPSSPPCHTRQVLKGVWPGVEEGDQVVLWGGGLWQWLDPLAAIRAMAVVREQRADVKLLFPGTRHPNPDVMDMPVRRHAVELAGELELDGCVFFGDWVPYAEWPNYLLEADVALSLHHDTLETRLAFRSRVLDYIWVGLPMIVTRGDAASGWVSRLGLGEVVGYERDDEIAAALLRLLEKPKSGFAARFERARAELTWEKAAEPLIAFCRRARRAPDKVNGAQPPPAAWKPGEPIAQRGLEFDGLRVAAAQKDAELPAREIARLQALVAGYERGRFIRLMRWLHGLWHRWVER